MFRPPPWMVFLFIGITVLFALGSFVTYRERGWTWVSIGLAGAAIVFGLGSILETLVLRIELTEDAMLVTDLRGRRRYGIDDIERIAEAKGAPPVLLLKDGKRVKLPSVGADLGNSVRAWLKQK